MDRRDFLKSSAAAGLAFGAMPDAFAQARGQYRNTLVLVELKGANDGLNTVVPYTDHQYYALRPRIAVKREDVLQLDERTGLHPALAPLMPSWQTRELAIVQGLGYATPNLSHFRSIEIWDTASKNDEYLVDGWLTRVFAGAPVPKSYAADGVVIGSNDLGPLAGSGTRAVALANTDQFVKQARLAQPIAAHGNRALNHVLKTEADIAQAAIGLAEQREFQTTFPTTPFGNVVRTAAQVIAAKAGVAVVRLTQGGYDTHQNQPNAHANLLKNLADGLVALKSALVELGRWDSTLVMTYAEFGRRAAENGSLGTDHGTSAPHFMMGGRVKGGLHGEAPRLDRLENGNLPFALDFRSYYATAIERHWSLASSVSSAALGGRFAPIDLLRV
jgi:uncharacterized protein (DUF1501 family)